MHESPSPYMMPELTFAASGEYETARLAAALAKVSVAGDLIRLVGDLGAGKSTFARHYIQTLGHVGDVPSPTYTLVQTYADTRFPLAHVDCYRMKEPAELDGLGIEAYRQHGILVVEWPEKGSAMVADGQPDFLDYYINSIENPGTLTLTFTAGETALSRKILLSASPSWQRRFGLLGKLGIGFGDTVLNRPVTEAGRKTFLDSLGLQGYTVEANDGDWSSRSYARVRLADGSTRMLMDSPPPLEGVAEYVAVADYYRGVGLRAAEIYGRNDAEGYLLTEDFGNTQLWDLVKSGDAQTAWYMAAADGLVEQCLSLRTAPAPEWARRYSPKDWWVEVVRFVNWYMPYARGRSCTLEEYAQWQALWMPLYTKVMALPQGLMMWDCQTPNMMVLGEEPKLENLALVDIQDARVASVGQDLSLFLRNIRSVQDDLREAAVLEYVAARLECDLDALKLAVDIASLHHSCRILGGLTRLHVRDGRSAPAVAYLARTWEVARQSYDCPELKAIVDFMQEWEVPGLSKLWKETKGESGIMGAPITTAMVLAAGLGTRLRPLTDTMPKPLINVGGKPVIIRILNMLSEAGIERVVINTHYLAHMLETAVKAATPVGMTVHFSYEEELLETGGGIKKALPLLGDDPFVVVNSDAVWLDEVKPLLKPLMAAFDGEKHDALLAVVPTSETKDFMLLGDFKFDKRTSRLSRKGLRETWDVVYAGVHVTKPGVVMREVDDKFSLNVVWEELREAGRLHGWMYKGAWREIGSHQGLERARALVSGG